MARAPESHQPSWDVDMSAAEQDLRPVHLFSLDLPLDAIPEPGEPCAHCGSPKQREFLDYDASSESMILRAVATPGYGCTGRRCARKTFYSPITVRVLKEAACQARRLGHHASAQQFENEARLLQGVPSSVGAGT